MNLTIHHPDLFQTGVFLRFIFKKGVPILGDLLFGQRQSVGTMDSASIHMDPGVKEAINRKGVYLSYTASYSLDLNPIEKCFLSIRLT